MSGAAERRAGEPRDPPIGELAERIGGPHVCVGTSADAVDGRVPRWVARPGTLEEVQHVVRFADRYDLAVVPTGLGGHLDVGGTAGAVDLVLSLDRLGRVVEHAAADMTVTVEAGCPLGELDERLAEAGQWLPIDPPFAAETSVGGLIAANLSGPLRASQGTVRDCLIGIRAVAGDGRLVCGGGRVVKNVAGYDLPKLHVGAIGTLGIVVEATFKVRPRPEREEALVVECAAGAAAALALDLRDAVEPSWLEIVAPGIAAPGAGVAVVAGFLGTAAEVEASSAAATGAAADRGAAARRIADGEALRRRIVDAVRGTAVLRIATLPGDLGAVLAELGGAAAWHAHAAAGTLRVGTRDAGEAATLLRALRARAEALGGSAVVERATPAVKQGLEAEPGLWGAPPPGFALMRGLKQAFDPRARLAPGRFVGGL